MSSIEFSIIVATKDAANVLDRCLDSIVNQSFGSFEVIVKDGCSQDATRSVVNRAAQKIDAGKVRFISSQDQGITDAWNQALPYAKGRWLYFLGADDVLADPRSLERVASVSRSVSYNSSVGLIYGGVEYLGQDGSSLGNWSPSIEEVLGEIRARMSLCHQGLFARRSLVGKLGFDRDLKFAADYDFVLRAVTQGVIIKQIPNAVVARVNVEGVTGKIINANRVLSEYRKIQRRQKLKVRPLWLWLMAKACTKKTILKLFGSNVARFSVDVYRTLSARPRRYLGSRRL